jgi:hypothetical protein
VERTIIIGTLRDGRSAHNDFEKWAVMWCRAMHSDITWPQRGQYRCKRCGRVYAVPWIRQELRPTPTPVIEIPAALEHARTA